MVTPELTRVFGQHGLYLRPSAGLPSDLSGNMLANVVSLHRDEDALAGQFRCLDPELPISTASLSLVYSLFMLESSPEPEALIQEIARSLQPEGVALLISLNPWSPVRWRWLLRNGRVLSSSSVQRMARDAGLEVIRHQNLGPCRPGGGGSFAARRRIRWLDGFRTASLLVLRRREAGLTPLRKLSPAVSLRPGMSAG
ncbi:MAG: methyltransferase domain-containing protein [Arenimonas sp.]|nr:methyltransferase domain-containing protein [Arenimonas sp.]